MKDMHSIHGAIEMHPFHDYAPDPSGASSKIAADPPPPKPRGPY
jgi:hypothetical protein